MELLAEPTMLHGDAALCELGMADSRRVWKHGVPPTDRDADGGAAGRADGVRSRQLYHVCC